MAQSINFANLTIEISESAHSVTYTFKGDVDENFRQQDVPRIKKANIIFELEAITNFNSCGIREWIYLIRDIGRLGPMEFRRCSVIMIDQINMVPDSLGDGAIESFFAPYFCSTHGESNQLIDVKKYLNQLLQKTAPEFKCAHCSQNLEFDALEESYFLFADTTFQKAG